MSFSTGHPCDYVMASVQVSLSGIGLVRAARTSFKVVNASHGMNCDS